MKCFIRILLGLTFSLFFLLFQTGSASAEETGFRFPTTCYTNGPSCDNMRFEDGLYNSWVNSNREEIDATFTDFGVPENAVIDDIQIKLRIRTSISGMSWFTRVSDDGGNTYYGQLGGRCVFSYSPDTCWYNTNTSFNSIAMYNLLWVNTDSFKQVNGILFNSPVFRFRMRTSQTINSPRNTDIDTVLFNIRYHIEEVEDPSPAPFLDLPWDYEGKNLSFSDAALSINSFFDHEYPLLSTFLSEPSSSSGTVITFKGIGRENKNYSTHDGYDYGRQAKAILNDPVLASAEGWVVYKHGSASGNMLMIDHENGYQTRYMHLLPEDLITNDPNQKVWVNARQEIGKIGSTGNSTGAHIHFMVIHDKDGDGSFNDNIPDGLVDPFGWQGGNPDPWPLYSFNYLGVDRAGDTSSYLWTKKLDEVSETVGVTGGSVSSGNKTLSFPSGSTFQNLTITLTPEPIVETSANLVSVGTSLSVNAKDTLGNSITQFSQPFTVTFDFSNADLSRVKTNTLSIYSSQDGINWIPEQTTIDLIGKTAIAEVDHMTHFALMGERMDVVAPITTAAIDGQQGEVEWYRSDVGLTLVSEDNEGGLGVDYTMVKVGDEEWMQYQEPLLFNTEDHYVVQFYSADLDENIEEVKTVEFTLDKTPPEAKIFVDIGKFNLVVEGSDSAVSKVVKSNNTLTRKKGDAYYTVTDQAGNSLVLDVRNMDFSKLDTFSLFSLTYNGITFNQPKNQYLALYSGKKEAQNILSQIFMKNNEIAMGIFYNKKKNESTIYTWENGAQPIKDIKLGLVIFKLLTENGVLKWNNL